MFHKILFYCQYAHQHMFLRFWNFFKSNSVVKLLIFVAVLMSISIQLKSNIVDDSLYMIETTISVTATILSFFMFIFLLVALYYLSFNLKKTVYEFQKKHYIFLVTLVLLRLLMNFATKNNFLAIVFYELFYIFVLLHLLVDVRKIILQQRENLHHSIFRVVREQTGLLVLASTPNAIYGKMTNNFNNYMIGFNTNIKTWLLLGVFIKMDKEGVYLKKTFITYNEIVMFNETFDKKIIDYTQSELETAIMYSI